MRPLLSGRQSVLRCARKLPARPWSHQQTLRALSHRALPPGLEYELQEVQEPHLFVVCRQLRTAPKAATRQQFYYILDGSVYQAPSLHAAMASRIVSPFFCASTVASDGVTALGTVHHTFSRH